MSSDFVLGTALHGETVMASGGAPCTKNEEYLLDIPGYVECSIRRRLNRFVVEVEVSGRTEHAHTNNTGRLLELLVQGRKAACLPTRGGKTAYRLFAISEEAGWALIDTQFQMRAFEQAVEQRRIPWLSGWRLQSRNPGLGESVLDYLFADENGTDELYMEVKSAVLRDGTYAMYPDCPTLRGQRHIRTLIDHARRGLRGAICFMAAFKGAHAFRPYATGDPLVAALLEEARGQGVGLRAISLHFDGKGIRLDNPDLFVEIP